MLLLYVYNSPVTAILQHSKIVDANIIFFQHDLGRGIPKDPLINSGN